MEQFLMAVFNLIDHQLATGTVTSIIKTGITTDYDHLLIYVCLQGVGASDYMEYGRMYLNEDTSTIYSNTRITGHTEGANPGGDTNSGGESIKGFYVPGLLNPDSLGFTEVWIPNYAQTTTQKALFMTNTTGSELHGTAQFASVILQGLYASTDAIDAVEFKSYNVSLAAGSSMTIYGVLGV